MSKELFDKEKVMVHLIQMSAKGMTKCVTGYASFPTEFILVEMDVPTQIKCVDRPVITSLLREEIAFGSATLKPVFCKDIQRCFCEDGISVGTVLSMSDMYTHVFALNVLVPEIAYFTYSQT